MKQLTAQEGEQKGGSGTRQQQLWQLSQVLNHGAGQGTAVSASLGHLSASKSAMSCSVTSNTQPTCVFSHIQHPGATTVESKVPQNTAASSCELEKELTGTRQLVLCPCSIRTDCCRSRRRKASGAAGKNSSIFSISSWIITLNKRLYLPAY